MNDQNFDPVEKPKHYNSSLSSCPDCRRRIECIDITRHMSFNLGNAVKYLWRHGLKNGIEDLKKAVWYIEDEIGKTERKNVEKIPEKSNAADGMFFFVDIPANEVIEAAKNLKKDRDTIHRFCVIKSQIGVITT